MSKVRKFDGNPNSKVVTFEIDGDLLGHFSKLVVTRNGKLNQYCPIASDLFSENGGIARVDLASRGGKTYLTLARKIGDWSEEMVKDSQARIADFLSKSKPAVYVEAISRHVVAQRPFVPSNPIQKLVQAAFNDQVNPILASDGGAMELMNVTIKYTGEISADVALIGSCNGCGFAESQTLGNATDKIREVLQAAKKQAAGNATVQKLEFTGITVKEIPELAIAK